MVKTSLVMAIFGSLFLNTIVAAATTPRFMTFRTTEDVWTIPTASESSLEVIDDNLVLHRGPFDLYKRIYFDEDGHVGMQVDTKDLERIDVSIGARLVDPFKTRSYDGESLIVDLNNVVRGHIAEVGTHAGLTGKALEDEVRKVTKKHLSMGGYLEVVLKYRGTPAQYYRLIPEQYGLTMFNQAMPINAQYSRALSVPSRLDNTVNLYYPFQYVKKDLDRNGFDWTDITRRISFGPSFIVTLGENTSMQGIGFLVSFGVSSRGLPIAGIGYGTARDTKPFMVITANPVEVARFFFDPLGVLKE